MTTLPSARAHLLFVRTPSQPLPQDPYHSLACSSHLTPHHLPILQTTYQNPSQLAQLLQDAGPEIYDGLILTSARSVQAIANAQAASPISLAEPTQVGKGAEGGKGSLYRTPIFVVGQGTAEALRTQLYPPPPKGNVFGNDGTTGSGEKLARFIIRYFKGDPPRTPTSQCRKWKLLYLVGDKNRDTLPRMLEVEDGRFELDRLRVYETTALGGSQLEKEVDAVVREIVGDEQLGRERNRLWIVFFSPSGAKTACREFRRRGWIPNGEKDQDVAFQIRIAAIGPVTRAYLQDDEGVKVDAEAQTPDAEDLLRCITEVEDKERGVGEEYLALGGGRPGTKM